MGVYYLRLSEKFYAEGARAGTARATHPFLSEQTAWGAGPARPPHIPFWPVSATCVAETGQKEHSWRDAVPSIDIAARSGICYAEGVSETRVSRGNGCCTALRSV